MNQSPINNTTDTGTEFPAKRPKEFRPSKHDYVKKPVRVAIRHDLSIELHGNNFSVSTPLTVDEALALISMLAYVVRERLCVEGQRK